MKFKLMFFSRLVFCLLCLYGVSMTVAKNDHLLEGLSYYTVQSNLLCLFVMGWALVRQGKGGKQENRILSIFKTGSVVVIFVTFLVFHFVLRPGILAGEWAEYIQTFQNTVVHYICPLWVLADYVVFDAKGKIGKRDPLLWALYPLAYFLYTNLYAWLGGTFGGGEELSSYPYFFLNPAVMGAGGVALAVGVLFAGFFALSYGFFGLDRLLGRREASRRKTTEPISN